MHTATVSDDAKAFGGLWALLAAPNAAGPALAAHVSRPRQPGVFLPVILLQRDGVLNFCLSQLMQKQ